MRNLVNIFKALGDESRLRILKLLEEKPYCVCELTFVLGSSQPTVSGHLKVLRDAGLVDYDKDGVWVNYHLCREEINQYAPILLDFIKTCINDAPKILSDKKRAQKADRSAICAGE